MKEKGAIGHFSDMREVWWEKAWLGLLTLSKLQTSRQTGNRFLQVGSQWEKVWSIAIPCRGATSSWAVHYNSVCGSEEKRLWSTETVLRAKCKKIFSIGIPDSDMQSKGFFFPIGILIQGNEESGLCSIEILWIEIDLSTGTLYRSQWRRGLVHSDSMIWLPCLEYNNNNVWLFYACKHRPSLSCDLP